MATIAVRDNPAENRYEISVDHQPAGFAVYYLEAGRAVFIHTEVSPAIEGRHIGSTLARQALDDVRRRGLQVVALCPFIAGFIRRHPEYLDLTPTQSHVRNVLDDAAPVQAAPEFAGPPGEEN